MTKIAIIEDDAVINQMYRMKFEAAGFTVATASDGETGVAMVEKFRPELILCDLQMPNMNGAEALSLIRKTPLGRNCTSHYFDKSRGRRGTCDVENSQCLELHCKS